jgi:hypothetical protein
VPPGWAESSLGGENYKRVVALGLAPDGTPLGLALHMSTDPTETFYDQSRIPAFCANECLPEKIRFTRGAVFMPFECEPHFKNFRLVFRHCMMKWGAVGPGGIGLDGQGLKIPACEQFPYDRWCKIDLAVISNDSRAGPYNSRQMQTPAKVIRHIYMMI